MNFSEIAWSEIRARHQHALQQLMSSSIDTAERNKLQKEVSRLGKLLSAYDELSGIQKEEGELETQVQVSDSEEMKALFIEELKSVKEKVVHAEQHLESLLYPPNEEDDRSVFLEIRAGAGGQEASLFVAD